MRVLLINVMCGMRSTGRICTDLAEQYISQGHEVRIAYGRGEVPARYEEIAYKIGTRWNVPLHALKARFLDTAGFESRHATQAFLAWADAYDPDLLYLHNLHGYYIHVGMLFSWIKTRPHMPVRWMLHDCWSFTGHCPHFTYANCQRWETGCHDCPQKHRYPASWLFVAF